MRTCKRAHARTLGYHCYWSVRAQRHCRMWRWGEVLAWFWRPGRPAARQTFLPKKYRRDWDTCSVPMLAASHGSSFTAVSSTSAALMMVAFLLPSSTSMALSSTAGSSPSHAVPRPTVPLCSS